MIAAVVLDFDGPIFDGRAARDAAYLKTVEHFGERVSANPVTVETIPLFGPTRFIASAFASAGLDATTQDELLAFYRIELERAERAQRVSDATRSWLDGLRALGLKLALLTGRVEANVRELLERLDLVDTFEVVVGGDTVDSPKPDPAGVLHIAQRLAITDLRTVVVIGDSDHDYDAARRAGAQYRHAGWSLEPNTVVQRKPNVLLSKPAHLLVLLAAQDDARPTSSLPRPMCDAIDAGDLGWFAGSGVSIDSGMGSWTDQYLPMLERAGIDWIADQHRTMPDVLQLGCVDEDISRQIFDDFSKAFKGPQLPNAYHFSMVRSKAVRIWTSNYDQLFERAIDTSNVDMRVVCDDQALLRHFADRRLVVKVNGDFEQGSWAQNLDWNLVATREQFDKADRERAEIWRLFEDDYRGRCLVFVGVSLEDPVLLRILTIAAGRVRRRRYPHYLLMKLADDVTERAVQQRTERSLSRYGITTLYFATYADISQFVASITSRDLRPIVGVSGDTDAAADDHVGADAVVLPGGSIDGAALRLVCSSMGEALAKAGYRVTSGGAPYVGIEAVNSAFEADALLGRFYLRKGGSKGTYQRTAPVVIVAGVGSDPYDAVRTRFIGELNILLAIGGRGSDLTGSAVIDEVERAVHRGVPVLIFPQAGGLTAAYRDQFLSQVGTAYTDARLVQAVRAANEAIGAVPGADLVAWVRRNLVGQVRIVVNALAQAAVDTSAARTSTFPSW